jgi:phosphatidylinositol alpha 1,6-mannosyltransferase
VNTPRVAFFTDSFHEVNGVALTSREFARFAREKGYPFLSIHTGPETRAWSDGCFETFELKNSRAVLQLDTNLAFDLLFPRHFGRLRRALARFRPDVVHVTGPGHCGILGAALAFQLGVPLAASWHTNLHEFAGRRLARALRFLPAGVQRAACGFAEDRCLDLTVQFYRLARVLFAPNPELVDLLGARTGRPTHLMLRGIDTALFSPEHRDRSDNAFVVGYVGRLSPEKNVRMLLEVQRGLAEAGMEDCRFLVVGEGSEREWLQTNLRNCKLTGVLRGKELARAYAGMDAFAFPSETDTFGNVILEAMASGVPPIVAAGGGPKYLVQAGVNGFQAANPREFVSAILGLQYDAELLRQLAANAREAVLGFSWASVFEGVYGRLSHAVETNSMRTAGRDSQNRPLALRPATRHPAPRG